MSDLIVPEQYKNHEAFKLPFSPDADSVRDADGNVVAYISNKASAEEALRLARVFASSVESLSRLHNLAEILKANTKDLPEYNHGALNENIDDCLICYIEHYIKEVLS